MSTRIASSQPSPMGGAAQHTSGIYADMTVDGPEIGTLVIIVDRAKNLPNRKAMGKQNPYCAARLGKEAKKTDTDKRGGQTPKWDQELRFVVHDSLDYHNLKLSVFSEDKKTDLVGEAWIKLDAVITPGGGKCDLWQTLNCKGKYSGEIRIELTYYDSRPRPEKKPVQEENSGIKQSSTERVKRRPLPNGPSTAPRTPLTPSTIPGPLIPGRARHGPRDLQAPLRANSLPLEAVQHQIPLQQQQHHPANQIYQHEAYGASLQHINSEPNLPIPVHTELDDKYTDMRSQSDPYAHPDFLPTLPPPSRQRSVLPDVYSNVAPSAAQSHRPVMQYLLPHAHSEPVIPQQQDFDHEQAMQTTLYTGAPEPLHDLEYQHNYVQHHHRHHSDIGQQWHHQPEQDSIYEAQQHQQLQQHYAAPLQHYHHEHHAPPPLPPMHTRSSSSLPVMSHSAPTTPQHSAAYDPQRTPTSGRPVSRGQQQYISNISPLQSIERSRLPDQEQTSYRPLPRDSPDTNYQPLPRDALDTGYRPLPRDAPEGDFQSVPLQPQSRYTPAHSPTNHRGPAYADIPTPHRHSIASSYAPQGLRQSPHPLSQETPRARSPLPEHHIERSYTSLATPYGEDDRHQVELNRHAITPVVKPRAISPSRHTASDGLKRTPDWKPKSTYSIQSPIRAFESSDDSPLAYTRTRPNNGTVRKSVSPHPSPSQPRIPTTVPYGPDSFDIHNPAAASNTARSDAPSGPITGWDGREIDPSDHLPVASWAPEPEVKTPNKAYGLGRDRDFGPRSAEATGPRFGRDGVLNVHRKGASADTTPTSTVRARLVKKSHPQSASPQSHSQSSPAQPLAEHPNYNPVPDPYAQSDYGHGRPGAAGHQNHKPRYSMGHGSQNYGHAPPDLPPKLPIEMEYRADAYGPDALSREIASIDIGTGSRGRASGPSPVAYVPVRSHRDRDSFY